MNISVFGLGYVGTVSAGCLAGQGHTVIGVDLNKTKVDMINQGIAPIIEKDIDAIVSDVVERGFLRATVDPHDAVRNSDLSFICVGTPSQSNGNLDLSHVRNVSEQIGAALRDKRTHHVIAGRSTMLPGSMRNVVFGALERYSGKKAGVDFSVCYHPEFLREGTAVHDYHNPPKTVIGEHDSKAGDMLLGLYEKMNAPVMRTSIETAEIVKYTDNTWHALKVTFANEIGNLCKAVGIDGYEVMELFCRDTKLNLSPCYMKPGFAFGGSCLPKDVRALAYKAKSLDLELPVLNAILPSNRRQIEKGIRMIINKGKQRIGVLGFSFKAGTDDLRESPMIDVIEALLGKGYELKLYDRNVKLAALMGANQDYIMNRISHISRLMTESIDEVIDFADTIVIGNNAPEFRAVASRLRPGQVMVDLVRTLPVRGEGYDGICW
ncbi:MAG: GDP-mannose dehydrogenase [Burkholderia sp.]|nr:GDP-mannose dehydrogenase [Burkholderia sp.]